MGFDARQIAAPGVWGQFALNILVAILFKLPLLTIVAISVGMATIAFYASTLTRNTLQALAPAVIGILCGMVPDVCGLTSRRNSSAIRSGAGR